MTLIRAILCFSCVVLVSCGSTMPTAAQMDQLESQVRREEEPEYARLSQMRAAGQLKSMGMPTPDLPVSNLPPGVGSIQGSLYTSSRLNGLGNQIQANAMQSIGTSSFQKGTSAGTAYDP